ncbi:MAG: hypothetical protein HC892_15060 [Saprospiraceae bacterium]|nr:hypothetical protein [Saprospiraceae bacterium]
MSLITINALANTLETTSNALLSVANGDGIVSRDDFQRLLEQTEDAMEKAFLDYFYNFLILLEDRSGVRVTRAVIDNGIAFIKEQVMPNFEVKLRFTQQTNQKIAEINELAFPMAEELLKITDYRQTLSPREVSEQIGQYTGALFFDDLGSEAAILITPFFLEHSIPDLSPKSFVEALGLNPDEPKGIVSRFESADFILYRFIDKHNEELAPKARAVVELMEENLSDLTAIVLGEDYSSVYESNHPVYLVGIGLNGNLAGFESTVIWT